MPQSRTRKGKKVQPAPKKAKQESEEELHNRIGQAYYKLMKGVGERIDAMRPLIRRGVYSLTEYELMAVGFRKIAEAIVFANLAGHEKEYAALYPNYKKDWRIKEIIQRIKAINPGYYPSPSIRNPPETTGQIEYLQPVPTGEWMTEDELVEMYNTCSGLIHAQNSFKEDIDLTPFPALFREWANKLIGLLNYHIVSLPDGKNAVSFQMRDSNTGLPSVWLFEDITEKMPPERLAQIQNGQTDATLL